jgi:hypothetical protein
MSACGTRKMLAACFLSVHITGSHTVRLNRWTIVSHTRPHTTHSHHRTTARRAVEAVDVPDSVIELLTGLRNYLQVG